MKIEELITEASSLLVRLREIQQLTATNFNLEAVTNDPTMESTTFSPTFQYNPPNNYLNAPDSGSTAWMLTSTALVLFMTMPGLAIYYGGMVSSKNVLTCVMQSFSVTCLITVLWLAFGYSLAFSPTNYYPQDGHTTRTTTIYGNAQRFWLRGLTLDSTNQMAPHIPESVYCTFQLTFAIITPALICGSFADRMRYWPLMLFIGLWSLTVYCPLAHTMWHFDGLLFNYGVLDFAGGNVVHISSGVAGLVAALIVGNRRGWKPRDYESHPPHNILLTFMGMSMLWVGWFGFNAGSAVQANVTAGMAMLNTQIATATAAIAWMLTEFIFRKKPSVLGMVCGAIAGLVAITPACGYVDPNGAFFTGLFGGVLCYFGSNLKHWIFKVDDALDAFGVHAIGGAVGGICTGFFATSATTGNPNASGVYYSNTWIGGWQLEKQIVGILYTIAWSGIVSFILLKSIDMTIGLRVSEEEEEEGLDSSLHGETIVTPEAKAEGAKFKRVEEGDVSEMVPASNDNL